MLRLRRLVSSDKKNLCSQSTYFSSEFNRTQFLVNAEPCRFLRCPDVVSLGHREDGLVACVASSSSLVWYDSSPVSRWCWTPSWCEWFIHWSPEQVVALRFGTRSTPCSDSTESNQIARIHWSRWHKCATLQSWNWSHVHSMVWNDSRRSPGITI